MTFDEYIDLISRAYFTISFGEGMDGYFIQPQSVGSIGFAVYNSDFFPDESWKDLLNVYTDYIDMSVNISNDINNLLNDKNLYSKTIDTTLNKITKLYDKNSFKDNLKHFYNKNYDFYPQNKE